MQLLGCLVERNDAKLVVLEKNLSIEKAIDGSKLLKLEKSIGDFGIITAICYLLNRFSTNFNVGKKLTPEQSAILASDIVEKYPYETIEDIVLMLKMVRQGIIGDGKDYKLDGQNVLAKWMPEYLDKKYTEIERQHKQIKEDNSGSCAVEMFYKQEREKKLRKQEEQKMYEEIDIMVSTMDRQMLEDLIIDWSKKPEFSKYMDYLKSKRKIKK